MHLLAPGAGSASLGYVTSSTPGAALEGWVGLALLSGGRQRIGARLIGSSPIHGETSDVEIVSPHMLDPENLRVRA
jgi:glycine cleavage system aminomethyltransferase T